MMRIERHTWHSWRGDAVVACAAAALLMLSACETSTQKGMKKVKGDEEAIQHASVAVNEVLRNSDDCAVAKPLLDEAYKRIDEVRPALVAPASKTTLDMLKAQADRISRACP